MYVYLPFWACRGRMALGVIMLTDRQRTVYDYLIWHRDLTGNFPTHAEIADHFGWASPNAAASVVKSLRKKGWLAPKGEKKGRMKLPTIPPVTVTVPDYIIIGAKP